MHTLGRFSVFTILTAVAGLGCASDSSLIIRTVSDSNPALVVVGVRVQVNDLPWATTDANGEVNFGEVSPPYTLRVHQTDLAPISGSYYHYVWELPGQTDNPLVLEVDGRFPDQPRTSLIAGAVSGQSGAPGTRIRLTGRNWMLQTEPDGSFSLEMSWDGPNPHAMPLCAFEVDDVGPIPNLPAGYVAYACSRLELDAPLDTEPESPGSLSGISLVLEEMNDGRVSGQMTAPQSPSAMLGVNLSLHFSDDPASSYWLGTRDLTGPTVVFDYAVPDIAGAEPYLHFYTKNQLPEANSSAYYQVTPNTGGLDMTLPTPVELLAPADGATITPATVFSWSPAPASGFYSLTAFCRGTRNGETHRINYRDAATTETQASLPAIAELRLDAGATCDWSVDWFPDASLQDAHRPGIESRYRRFATSTTRSATVE